MEDKTPAQPTAIHSPGGSDLCKIHDRPKIIHDEDLKRMKEEKYLGATHEEIQALLARLEAAEYYLLHTLDDKPHCENCERHINTWRKTAGKNV